MTSRRRSNRLILQEVIEESRKEAEVAVTKSASKQGSQGEGSIDAEKDLEALGGGSRIKGKGGEDASSRGQGIKRLRKLSGVASKKSKRVSTGNQREADEGSGGSDSNGDAVALSDGLGDPDFGAGDDDSGVAAPEIESTTRKPSGRNVRGALRNSNRRKPLSIHDADSDGSGDVNDESDPDDDSVDRKRSQKTTAITSKSSSSVSVPTKAIPRRKPESSTQSTSLLTHMKPAPLILDPQLSQGTSRLPTSSKTKALSASATSRPPVKTPREPFPTNAFQGATERLSPKRDESQANDEVTFMKRCTPPPQTSHLSALASLPRQQVMTDLERLCDSMGGDVRFALPPSRSIDLSGSFLSEDDRYDFFDTNAAGEIVFQPKVPIFPEEFPQGMTGHSLSWWGILDPALGDGKFRDPVPSVPGDQSNRPTGASGSLDPGSGHYQQSQWSQYPPPQPSLQGPLSFPQDYPNRGPSSWTPPRGAGRSVSGGPPPNWAPQPLRPDYRGPFPPPPPSNRPPRTYEWR